MAQLALMLGNEAIARGLVENGCAVATSYPGTPASEILAAVLQLQREQGSLRHVQWAVNEKVAFEIAYAAAMTGLRAAVSMKQVGLNVASDPLMSAAYMGVRGGLVVISADDPGPHSSQTEQDSRLLAMAAKIPVLDPSSPDHARKLIAAAFRLSETFEIPVMLRPTTRVCHARQSLPLLPVEGPVRSAAFDRDPARWAATPKFRLQLHRGLEKKIARIAAHSDTAPALLHPAAQGKRAVVVSGVAAAHAREAIRDLELEQTLPLYQVFQPYPLHTDFIDHLLRRYEEILVLEETTGVIEMQIADRRRCRGKMDGTVGSVGELLPEVIAERIATFSGKQLPAAVLPAAGGRRPTLCPGCPHRASFFAIRKAAPRGIYTSDIGCYTLGLNLGAVDTVLCMGAAIGQAAGFHHAFKNEPKPRDIVATIGDSTFYHAGVPALIDAVHNRVRFTLVILDNRTTAMTGNQPTPADDTTSDGSDGLAVPLENLVRGCGVTFCRTGDPYEVKSFTATVREAVRFARNNGPAVVIARHPCLLGRSVRDNSVLDRAVEVTEACDGCGWCLEHFECPALVPEGEGEPIRIDPVLCVRCGVCAEVCPKEAIRQCG
ncbi:MAG: indolepyruvate ferredoxin oxidoreductase subunit alpha [Desulfobacteraceae bacterium]|nr:indolepyruvate ferredoxin oxidoreductase subunit alpha [Desulfobacteraceae bacterium]